VLEALVAGASLVRPRNERAAQVESLQPPRGAERRCMSYPGRISPRLQHKWGRGGHGGWHTTALR